MRSSYLQDLAEIAVERRKAGKTTRREFLQVMSTLMGGAAIASIAGEVSAQQRELVVATYSSDSNTFFDEAWGKPFSAKTGTKMTFDAVTPVEGKIIAMVESGQITWDLSDSEGFSAISLGKGGYLEPIDYSIVDKSMVREGWAWEYGVANHTYAHVLVWDTTKVSRPPTSWKDFFNVTEFPGKRTAWKYMIGALEAALLADGVDRADIYPMDVDRAIAKYKAINDDMIYWNSGGEAAQLFYDGEVVMGNIWHSRARALREDTNGRYDFTWVDGISCPGSWVIPKGGKNIDLVQQFIRDSLQPERQVVILENLYTGPTNPAASAAVPDELKLYDPSDPRNQNVMLMRGEQWYADNYNDVLGKFITAISS